MKLSNQYKYQSIAMVLKFKNHSSTLAYHFGFDQACQSNKKSYAILNNIFKSEFVEMFFPKSLSLSLPRNVFFFFIVKKQIDIHITAI